MIDDFQFLILEHFKPKLAAIKFEEEYLDEGLLTYSTPKKKSLKKLLKLETLNTSHCKKNKKLK